MNFHIKYDELMDKANAIFAEDDNIRERIYAITGHSPVQTMERKDEREEIVRETERKFHAVCRFFRDFIERNYASRIKPFRSYSGILEAYDLADRFMGDDLGAITMEALIAIGLPGEKGPLRNLMRMFLYDYKTDEKTGLKRLVIFIHALEEAKRFQESKGDWGGDDQTLSSYYSGVFLDAELTDMEKMDGMLASIRSEESYQWYLRRVIYPLVLQKFDSRAFEIDGIKNDNWRRVWEKLKQVPPIDGDGESCTEGNYSLGNEDVIEMIIRDALSLHYSWTYYSYHPMWLFGSRLYYDALCDYYRMFQQNFELYQMRQMLLEY